MTEPEAVQRIEDWELVAWLGDHSQGGEPQACAETNFTRLSHPHLSRFRMTQVGGQVQHWRYKSRASRGGVGLRAG